ncbi:hypothetical protein Mame01_42930 [Microbispora amethystogenes]|nr:hypothetical protein Mame01_42930 [Microbispora amethystogenes]
MRLPAMTPPRFCVMQCPDKKGMRRIRDRSRQDKKDHKSYQLRADAWPPLYVRLTPISRTVGTAVAEVKSRRM